MDENTIIKITWLAFKESDIFQGEKTIKEEVKSNLDILYEYNDIETETELYYWYDKVEKDFSKVLDFLCSMLELDYEYIVA